MEMKQKQGKYFGELLARQGVNFTQMSENLGVSYQLVQQYTTGRSTPTEEKMAKIAEILKLPLWYMYEDHQKKLVQIIKSMFVTRGYFIIEQPNVDNIQVDLLCLHINPQLMAAIEISKNPKNQNKIYLNKIKQVLTEKYKINNICVFGLTIGNGEVEMACVGKKSKELPDKEEFLQVINKV
ncbi:MAG: helix-turn-helix domain-containing protein [Candidatus Margulisbacteria bacterium]|jgi:transcriptional regulator with XRE-family HTH domain|nr:helix-turn-helix domain-containing protein [Candidatus Margulisiibacteriota bacterium]